VEWEFTPDDVVKGDAAYTIADFRRDLEQELRMNVGMASEADFRHAYDVVYDLCYWLATGKDFVDFARTLQDYPAAIRLAKSVREYMQDNVDMLGAVLQRMIMDRVEGGLPLEQALAAVDAHHRSVLSGFERARARPS
jgi:hypothetical protein